MRKAIALYEEAAGEHAEVAFSQLGLIYEIGNDVPVDYNKAVYYYQQGVDLGDDVSKFRLAYLYMIKQDVFRKDVKTIVDLLLAVSPKDICYPHVCWYLGKFYSKGVTDNGKVILREDKKKALELLLIAAERGAEKQAYSEAAQILSNPESDLFDFKKAMELYKTGAQKGDEWSWIGLAGLHLVNENQNHPLCDNKQGIYAANRYLECGDGKRGLKEFTMRLILLACDRIGRYSKESIEEYDYLLRRLDKLGMVPIDDKHKEDLTCTIGELLERKITISGNEGALVLSHLDDIIRMIEDLLDKCDHNAYLKDCAWDIIITDYMKLAGIAVHHGKIYEGKRLYEQAADMGSQDAQFELRHFRTGLFGDLKYVP